MENEQLETPAEELQPETASAVASDDENEQFAAEEDQNSKYDISGEKPVILDGTEIEELSINQAGRDIITHNTSYFKSPKDQKFSCPYCDEELDVKQYGKHRCKNCNRTFIIKNRDRDKDIVLYKTLLADEAKKYDKILAHISNNLQDRNYDAAFQFCKKAEEIAPGEVSTWEQFTLTEFLLEITKEANKRKPTWLIIRSIRSHIEKCKDHGMTEEEYEPLVVDISNRLFNIEKSRIKSVQAQYRDNSNNAKWSKFNLTYLQNLLESFDICYMLYPDSLFLEGYVDELKKDYKWIVKTKDGDLINYPACGSFNAVKKLNLLVTKIKLKKTDYLFPEIAEERFIIKKISYMKINAVTSKHN